MRTQTQLIELFNAIMLDYRAKPTPEVHAKLRGINIRIRAMRKSRLVDASSRQGIAAKARLILEGKGRNGKSMNPALLERHLATR